MTIKASKLESGGSVRLESASGEIALLTDTSSSYSQEKKTGSNVVWQSSRDKGNADQTVEHTEITATGAIQVLAAQGIRVEYRDTGNVNDSITQLAKQPGLAWMEQLRGDPKVNWQAVAEAHEKWDYKSEGLTGAGAALLSLAVAVATSGWGTALTSSMGLAANGMTAAAVQGGFASLCSQAAVGLVNNKGDVLATLQGLASDQGMRALASAMLTASLTRGVTELAQLDEIKKTVDAVGSLGKVAQDTVINGGVQAGVSTALYGGDLGQNLLNSLRGAAVSSLGAKVANEIGAAAVKGDLDYLSHKIAHAALGGAMAAAEGKDAASGALGGVVGEVAAEAFLASKLKTGITGADMPALEERGINYGKLAAGLVAAIAGADVGTASMTADNAVRNNWADTAWDALCVLYDSGKIAYGYYKDDKGMIKEGFIDLALDSTAFFIPFVPAGLSKVAKGADKTADAIKATERAENVVNAERLRKQLAGEEAGSLFTAEGKLTKEALGNAKEIMGGKRLGNPNIPDGYVKFETPTSSSPSGDFKVHFYAKKGPDGKPIDPWYGLDYKTKFNK